jgi:hypothetical protein
MYYFSVYLPHTSLKAFFTRFKKSLRHISSMSSTRPEEEYEEAPPLPDE